MSIVWFLIPIAILVAGLLLHEGFTMAVVLALTGATLTGMTLAAVAISAIGLIIHGWSTNIISALPAVALLWGTFFIVFALGTLVRPPRPIPAHDVDLHSYAEVLEVWADDGFTELRPLRLRPRRWAARRSLPST